MRLRRKNNIKLNILLTVLLLLTIFGVSYSYLSLSLNIHGTVKGSRTTIAYVLTPDSDPNLNLSATLMSKSIENGLNKYQYLFNITNIGNAPMDNLTITITFKDIVQSPIVSDYGYNLKGKVLTITVTPIFLDSNQTLPINFFISAASASLGIQSIKLTTSNPLTEISLSKLNVGFAVSSSSGSYIYKYNVTVTNKTGGKINYWQISIALPEGTTYQSGSNAVFETHGNILVVKDSTGKINNNSSITFVLQISTNIKDFIPTNIKAFVR